MVIRQREQKGLKRTVINWYNDVLIWLSNHKKIAFFLSHGGLHFLVLILCLVGAFFMYEKVQSYNQRDLRQFSLRIEGDTLKNYKLTHVSFHSVVKAEMKRKDLDIIDSEIEGFNYHFKYEKKGLQPLKLLKCDVAPYDTLDVDLIQRINLTVDNPSSLKLINSFENVTNPNELDSHHTSKFNSNYITNETNTVLFHGFTSEDSIKEDEFGIMLPNLTNDWKGDNPNYCCFFGFHAVPGTYNLDSTSRIRIQYNKYPYKEGPNHYDTEYDLFPEAPMVIECVFPTPTEITLENIIYDGKDVEKVFEQGGVYVTAVDPVKKAHANRMEFLWTVIIGVTLAFALDIIVQLILKWRKLKYEKWNK